MGDPRIRLISHFKNNHPTKTERQLRNKMAEMLDVNNPHRRGGQGTDKLENRFLDITKAVARKRRAYFWRILRKDGPIRAVESQKEIRPDTRNIRLRTKGGSVRGDQTPAIHTSSLSGDIGNVSETRFNSKGGISEAEMCTDEE